MRCNPEQSPGNTRSNWVNVLQECDVRRISCPVTEEQFNQFKFFTNDYANDLYFCGFKTGDSLPGEYVKIQEQVNHMQTLGHLFASLWGGSEDDVRDNIILDYRLSPRMMF